MASTNEHVVRREDRWTVRGERNPRDTSHHRKQAHAIDAARNQRSEVVIPDRQGPTRAGDSHSNDPNPPTDRVH